MPLKTKYDLCFDSSIAAGATDIQSSAILPTGKTARLVCFGGYDPLIADKLSGFIALQWGSTGSWSTVRAGGDGFFNLEWPKGKDFIGDGSKRFRLVRQNKSSSDKIMVAWMYVLIVD